MITRLNRSCTLDSIRQKLELLDNQHGSVHDFHNRLFGQFPLVITAIGLIAGIIIQKNLMLNLQFWLILLYAAAAATALCLIFLKEYARLYTTAYLATACFCCLGAIRLITYQQPASNDIRNFINTDTLATIRGSIVSQPRLNYQQDWIFARFQPKDPSSSFYLSLDEVETKTGWQKISGDITVRVAEPTLDLKTGDYIQAYCWLDTLKPVGNPGQFNTTDYFAAKNIFVAAFIKTRSGIELLNAPQPHLFVKFQSFLQNTARRLLMYDQTGDDQTSAMLEALLLGQRKNIDSRILDAFQETGLLHLVSLSGLHVAILLGSFWWLARFTGLSKPLRAALSLIALILFAIVVPPAAPTLRAVIIGAFFCLAAIFKKNSNSLNTLALSAIVLLLFLPTDLYSPSWQLSFAAMLGILLFAEPIRNFLIPDILASVPDLKKSSFAVAQIKRFSQTFAVSTIKIFSLGLAAWLGNAGILLYHFYTITPLTTLWTVLVSPLVTAIMLLGFAKILFAATLPTIAALLATPLNFTSDIFIRIVETIGRWNISHILIGFTPLKIILLYYGIVAFLFFTPFRRLPLRKIIASIMIAVLAVSLVNLKWQRTHHRNLQLTCLSIGHGQAIFAALPGKANILFDAGSISIDNCGRKVILPFLNYQGIETLDAVILSHNDFDHINGLPEIIETRNVKHVYANDSFGNFPDQSSHLKFLHRWLAEQNLAIEPLPSDFHLNSPAVITPIWPDQQICSDPSISNNNKSQVILIEYAGRKILLCSDIEKTAQQKILEQSPDLKVDILIAPHHGSVSTVDNNFLQTVATDTIIASCNQNLGKKISAAPNNKKILTTAEQGAVTVTISPDGKLTITPFLGK